MGPHISYSTTGTGVPPGTQEKNRGTTGAIVPYARPDRRFLPF